MFGEIPLNYELQLLIFVTALGKAYNTLDVEHIEQLLDDDIKYESQQVLCPLKGKEAVLDYLRKKFATLRNTPGSELFAEIGFMGSQEREYIKAAFATEGQPCLILSQGEKERKLAVVLVEGLKGKIRDLSNYARLHRIGPRCRAPANIRCSQVLYERFQ